MKHIIILAVLLFITGCSFMQKVAHTVVPPIEADPCIWSETNQGGYKAPFYQQACRLDLVIRAAYKDINRRDALPDLLDAEKQAAKDRAIQQERATVNEISRLLDEVKGFYEDGDFNAVSLLNDLEIKLIEAGYEDES